LHDLGFVGVEHVSFGRTITIDIDAKNSNDALSTVENMCAKLLANPVIEYYTIEATS
jgi:phosphoribosylformylglycinamidine synthase PurS subunit